MDNHDPHLSSFRNERNRVGKPISEAELTAILNLLDGARDALDGLDKGYREKLYELLAELYGVAQFCGECRRAWVRLTNKPFFSQCKRKRPQPGDDLDAIILWVLRYAFRAASTGNSPAYNRAYKYATALQQFARDELSRAEVVEQLQQKGADFVWSTSPFEGGEAENDGAAGDAEVGRDDEATDDLERGPTKRGSKTDRWKGPTRTSHRTYLDDLNDSENDEEAAREDIGDDHERDEDRTQSEPSDEGPTRVLEVEVDEQQLNQVLALNVGEKAELTVKCVRGPVRRKASDWKRIVCKHVQIL